MTKLTESWSSYNQHRRHLAWEETSRLVSEAEGRLATLDCVIASIQVQVGTLSLLLPSALVHLRDAFALPQAQNVRGGTF